MTWVIHHCEGCHKPVERNERVRRIYTPEGEQHHFHDDNACIRAWRKQREDERREQERQCTAQLGYE
jgi:hypothetical protein